MDGGKERKGFSFPTLAETVIWPGSAMGPFKNAKKGEIEKGKFISRYFTLPEISVEALGR